MAWHLKGHGAANVVYSYSGEAAEMRGHVLRVRKPSAHTPAALDNTIWAGVLQISEEEPTTYELSYMLHVIAPLLGRQYIFPGVPYPLPHELRATLGLTADDPDPSAVLQPDHSTFQAAGLPGFVGVGPAVCLEIKPKWGLHPAELPPLPEQTVFQNRHVAESSCEKVVCADGQAAGGGETATVGPTAPDCKGAHADIRRRYTRFMLHMLYKHVKSGVPLSTYNPLELFSGEPHRMQNALWRLLQSPSNNLRVFKDGVPVYGEGSVLCTVDPGPNNAGVVGGLSSPDSAAPGGPSLLDLDTALQGFVAGGEARGSGPQSAGAARGGEGSYAGSGRVDAARARAVEAVEVGTLRLDSSGQQGRSNSNPEGPEYRSLRAVVALTVLALQQEGVLARLHKVQSLDLLGAEGALRLYEALMAGRGSPSAPPAAASASTPNTLTCPAQPASDITQCSTTDNAFCSPIINDNISSSSSTPPQDAQTGRSSSHAEAGRPTDSNNADWAHHLEALRGYLMSATGKDCGIMITMQRAEACKGAAYGAKLRAGVAARPAACPLVEELMAPKLMGPGTVESRNDGTQPAGGNPGPRSQRPWVGLLREPETGAMYLYKIAIVDLDLKMAAKIPTHAKLERSLLTCAAANPQLLQELAASASWVP